MSGQYQNNRKLTAILFADMKGYTGLMQESEGTAMALLARFEEVANELSYFRIYLLERDPFLIPIHDKPAFQEITGPKLN